MKQTRELWRVRRVRTAATTAGAALCLLGCLLLTSSCSSSGSGAAGGPGEAGAPVGDGPSSDDASLACNNGGMPIETFSEGMKKTGTDGVFTFQIVKADPSPPTDPLVNSWTLQVLDKSGAVVKDAVIELPGNDSPQWTFTRDPWMPVMKHGPTLATTYASNGDGTTTAKIDFSMGGYWRLYIKATSGSMTDFVTLSICLP